MRLKSIRFRPSWKLKMAVLFGALFSSIALVSLNSSVLAETEETEEVDRCSLQSRGQLSAILIAFSRTMAPVTVDGDGDPSTACSSLDEFTFTPPDIAEVLQGSGVEASSGNYVYGGATGTLANYYGMMYETQPASTPTYTRYLAEKAGVAQDASAAVSMSKALSPVIIIWQEVRNLAYIFMTVVMLIMGLILMFRMKTGGGGEPVTIVSSLAGMAVSLVLITFSYPLGALLADIGINVGNGLVTTIFDKYINASEIMDLLETPGTNYNILTLTMELQKVGFGNSARTLLAEILHSLHFPLTKISEVFSSMEGGVWPIIGDIASGLSMMLFGIFESAANSVAGSPLITAIVSFIIFTTMVRMLFGLMFAYFSIALKIAFSPMAFIAAAFPGGLAGVLGWVKSVLADALVFPTMWAMLLMSAVFFNLRSVPLSEKCPQVVTESGPASRRKSTIYDVVPLDEAVIPEECYPSLLPPEFNYWPVPFGYMRGVSPDELIRALFGIGLLLTAPTAGAMWKEILGVKEYRFFQLIGGGVKIGLSSFGTMISRVPSLGIGKSVGQLTSQLGQSF